MIIAEQENWKHRQEDGDTDISTREGTLTTTPRFECEKTTTLTWNKISKSLPSPRGQAYVTNINAGHSLFWLKHWTVFVAWHFSLQWIQDIHLRARNNFKSKSGKKTVNFDFTLITSYTDRFCLLFSLKNYQLPESCYTLKNKSTFTKQQYTLRTTSTVP